MAHNPLNHPLRPVYRAIGGVVGLYFVIFGVVGMIATGSHGLVARDDTLRALGLGTNLLWSIISLVLGAVVLTAAVLGRNLDTAVDKYVGWGLLVVGSFALAVSRTGVNVLNFTIGTVIVTYLAGLLLIVAGLYSKVGPEEHVSAPRPERERQAAAR